MKSDQPAVDSGDVPRICHDPLTGRPVFVAPQRGGKPNDRALERRLGGSEGPRAWCPFCAGNESRTPPDHARSPADASLPWRARIVPNTFPITVTNPPHAAGVPRAAAGVHDVVIESPRHERSILAIDAADWRDVWSLCRHRLAEVAASPAVAWATVFKNSGPKAGASLEHVHSQLVGLDIVPPTLRDELVGMSRDSAMFPRLIDQARRGGRLVAELGDVVAIVPPAPRQPYETWIVVASAEPHFHAASAARVAAVADLTRDVVARIGRLAPECHYNWWLHEAPARGPHARDLDGWHWHVEVLPRLSEFAGFEIGTGCHITTLPAAEAARHLRDAAG